MHPPSPDSRLRRSLSTLPVLILLAGTVLHWTASAGSSRLIELGESLWPGYAVDLRVDRRRPTLATDKAPPQGTGADDDLIGDLIGEPTADDALIGDLLGEVAPDPEDGPKADDALIGDLLGEDVTPTAAPPPDNRARLALWEEVEAQKTPVVRIFRAIETSLAAFSAWGGVHFGSVLVLLLGFAGTTATATRAHISLRPIQTRVDDRVSQLVQLVANLCLALSLVQLYRLNASSGTDLDGAALPLLWAAAFLGMSVINVWHLARPHPDHSTDGRWLDALLTPPLYTSMALLSFGWFAIGEDYAAGLGVYLQKLTEHAELYVFVGLYVWTGMLLKRTRLADLGFDLLRPWRMPPELLAVVVVLIAALPTAWSGASGIFVIATGGLIFRELSNAGARPQLALAATAMSGSLGVVLSPCLLVVIVAYLNPPTTEVLYSWGKWVFLLTGGLFALAVLLGREGPLRPNPLPDAKARTLDALKALVPYVGVGAGLLLTYTVVLGVGLDEHTAPVILPVMLGAVMLVDRRTAQDRTPDPTAPTPTVIDATSETAVHIGALLLLMSVSIALGGVFERSEIMSLVPSSLGSPFSAMAVLVVVLVGIGMTMDPYGAVILVSATIAQIAYASGIDEAHFWMVVLVAFELGYLTPPVALNHLLTRQVIGNDAYAAALTHSAQAGFWRRHERVLLPVAVMGVALVLVAFVPLLVAR